MSLTVKEQVFNNCHLSSIIYQNYGSERVNEDLSLSPRVKMLSQEQRKICLDALKNNASASLEALKEANGEVHAKFVTIENILNGTTPLTVTQKKQHWYSSILKVFLSIITGIQNFFGRVSSAKLEAAITKYCQAAEIARANSKELAETLNLITEKLSTLDETTDIEINPSDLGVLDKNKIDNYGYATLIAYKGLFEQKIAADEINKLKYS